jgi:hypothetical protein
MSDDEYDGYEEYDDDVASAAGSDAASEPAAAGEPVLGLDADADSDIEADGSDVMSDSESEDEVAADVEPELEAVRARADPVTSGANRPVRVIVVPKCERITDNRLHKSEASYVISVRAQQIARSATNFASASHTNSAALYDPCAIAQRELIERRCPLLLRRQVGWGPDGEIIVEEWCVREMALPQLISVPLA